MIKNQINKNEIKNNINTKTNLTSNPLSEENITLLVQEIKKKKELQQVNDNFVQEHLLQYLQQNSKLLPSLTKNPTTKLNQKSAVYKQIVKEVRAKLRRMYGLFRIEEEVKEREILLQEWLQAKENKKEPLLQKLLETHSSTKERLPFYSKLYQQIFAITGKPNTILDLACGINPFSLEYMNLRNVCYYAYDLNEGEIHLLNTYFTFKHKENKTFIGKAAVLDLLHWEKLANLGPVDICFLFKIVDVLDAGKGHKVSEMVIKNVPAKYVVVGFATKTMSGKDMNAPERKWMEWMCNRLEYKYNILTFPNEIFYVIKKQ